MGDFAVMFSGKSFDVRGLGSHLWEILVACSLGGLWMNERLGFTPMGDFGVMFSGKSFDVRGLGSHLWECRGILLIY